MFYPNLTVLSGPLGVPVASQPAARTPRCPVGCPQGPMDCQNGAPRSQNGDPRPPKWSLQASRCSQSAGRGPAAGGEALRIYAAPGLWPAVGVVSTPPRKVLTFPEGNYEVFALCRRPTQPRSKIVLFRTWSKKRKNVAKLSPKGTPNGAKNLKNLLKCRSEGLLKSKWCGKRTNF